MQRAASCHSSRSPQPTQQQQQIPPHQVRCTYGSVFQRVPTRAHAHAILLCVLHAAVQGYGVSSSVPGHARTRQGSRSASCALFGSRREALTDRMATAELTSHASCVSAVLLLLPARLFLAPSVPMTLCSRRSSGHDARKREQQSAQCCRKLDALSMPSIHRPLHLLLSSCISLLLSVSVSALFLRCTSLVSRR